MVHLTVGVVNNVGKPWERVANLMQNSRTEHFFSLERKEKAQSHIIGLLFRFSQQEIFVKLRFSYELSSNGVICDKHRRHFARGFVWCRGRTPCLTEVPRSVVVERSTTQQCDVIQIVNCAKTEKGQIQQKARCSGGDLTAPTGKREDSWWNNESRRHYCSQ